MKKENFIAYNIIIICIILSLLIIKISSKWSNNFKVNNVPRQESLLIMCTDKKHISSYIIFNLSNKKELHIFERKNECYSDFAIDKTGNYLYYSNLVNGKYKIFKVNLDIGNETNIFRENYYGGDIFDLCDETLIFRAISNDRRSYVIGEYSLINNKLHTLDNFSGEFDMFNFYIDKGKKVIYTIEYSIIEAENIKFPNIPLYNIFRYDMNNKQKELIYSTNKIITSISVDRDENKILFEAESVENDIISKKIYLLNLQYKTENILLENNTKLNNINFENINKPKFTSDNKGFYFLATTNESTIIEKLPNTSPTKSKAIYYYNLASNDIKLIYNNKTQAINDFKIIDIN